jgi:uncharacterized protein DUF3551
MRVWMIAGLALCGVVTAMAGPARAYVDYPWCVNGETRGMECYFNTKDQCAQDGRGRGFGGQCMRNPYYKGGAEGAEGQSARTRPDRVRGARASAAEPRSVQPSTPAVYQYGRYQGTDPDGHIRSQLGRDGTNYPH